MSLWPGRARKPLGIGAELQGTESEDVERGGWSCMQKETREQDRNGNKYLSEFQKPWLSQRVKLK